MIMINELYILLNKVIRKNYKIFVFVVFPHLICPMEWYFTVKQRFSFSRNRLENNCFRYHTIIMFANADIYL